MALKPDRIETQTDVSFFSDATATRGGVASVKTAGSGVSMDDSSAVVEYTAALANANPVGILVNDIVDLDLTRQHINWHKDEVQKGGKVTLLQIGQVTTSNLDSGAVPSAGSGAFVHNNGNISTTGGGARVGTFLSSKDSDGYAKVAINIA
jgi:hypothetical protein